MEGQWKDSRMFGRWRKWKCKWKDSEGQWGMGNDEEGLRREPREGGARWSCRR